MRFKIDENLPVEIAALLSDHGHDAITVAQQGLKGQDDSKVSAACLQERRALMTLDLDFSDLRTYPPDNYHGIIVLRPTLQDIQSLLRIVGQVLPLMDREPVAGTLWVVSDHKVRIRGA